MNWTYVTETLFAKYQLHNTAVGLAFFLVLCFIYVKFSLNANDNNHKFNFIGGQLADLKADNKVIKADNKVILETVNEHDFKISKINEDFKEVKLKLDEKWREVLHGKKEGSTSAKEKGHAQA